MKTNPSKNSRQSQARFEVTAAMRASVERAKRKREAAAEYHRKKCEARTLEHFSPACVRELCRLASGGNQTALALAWRGATELAQTILAVAESEPERLKELAPFAAYMPALLSRSKSFNKTTAQLAERVNLAANLAASHRPRLRLDSLTTRLVVELFERFDWTRMDIQCDARAYRSKPDLRKKLRKMEAVMEFVTTSPKRVVVRRTQRRGNKLTEKLVRIVSRDPRLEQKTVTVSYRTLEDYLVKLQGFYAEDLRLLDLEPLNSATVNDWWNKVFKPHLEDDWTMLQLRGTPLHRKICASCDVKVNDWRKDYLVKDELKRRCQDSLERLAKSLDSSKPPPENR